MAFTNYETSVREMDAYRLVANIRCSPQKIPCNVREIPCSDE